MVNAGSSSLKLALPKSLVALDGLDALVFTGDIGERAAALRARAAARLSLLAFAREVRGVLSGGRMPAEG